MKWTVPSLLMGIAVFSAACGPGARNDDDQFGNGDGGNNGSNGSNGSNGGDGCSAASKLIYVVQTGTSQTQFKLAQFDPTTKTFNDLGTLSCPGSNGYAPFSMAVDRNAQAYVLYADTTSQTNSKIYKVDTTQSGLPCTATSFSASADSDEMVLFGMGYSTDTAGGDTDQLYIAGGTAVATGNTKENLKTLDTNAFTYSGTGKVTGSPELTGNANAELWGFFPDSASPRIEQIDKMSGSGSPVTLDASLKGDPAAWAFGFYGGNYWVFLEKTDAFGDREGQSTVYEVTPTGSLVSKTVATGREIVGAGVSTCAPVVIE